jgi:hypothetical protein
MRPLGIGLFVIVLSAGPLAMAACGFDGVGGRIDAGADGPGSARAGDGGAPTDAGEESSTELFLDSGVDAAFDAAACNSIALDPLGTGSWELLGSAKVIAGQVHLTTANSGGSAGALWWKTPLTFSGRLHVVVDFAYVLATGAQGNGLTVSWLPTTSPYELGLQAGSYGICNVGLDGVAAAIDTLENKLVMVASVKNCDTRSLLVATIPQLTQMAVDITQTSITATVGVTAPITVSRPATSPSTGYLGFTASTGTIGHTGHILTAVHAFDCP